LPASVFSADGSLSSPLGYRYVAGESGQSDAAEKSPFLACTSWQHSLARRPNQRTTASILTGCIPRAAGAGDVIEITGDLASTVRSIAVFFILPRYQALLHWGKSSSLRSLTIQNERSTALATLYAGRGLLIVLADDGNWAEQLMYAECIDR
jgi:hypothetical protein